MPETAADGAINLLTRFGCPALVHEMAKNSWPVTLECWSDHPGCVAGDVDRLIQRADALMYRAKKNGKGRLEHEYLDVVPSASQPGKTCVVERRATAPRALQPPLCASGTTGRRLILSLPSYATFPNRGQRLIGQRIQRRRDINHRGVIAGQVAAVGSRPEYKSGRQILARRV